MPTFNIVNFLIINPTLPEKTRGLFLITFNDKAERDAFTAKETQIQIGAHTFKVEAHSKDQRLAAIRLPIQFDAEKKAEIAQELRQGLTDYFSKNYADAYDFKKPIETVSINSIRPDSPLENPVNPVPAAVLAVIAAPPAEDHFKKAISSISEKFNDFIKAPTKHPIVLGVMGALAAFSLGFTSLPVFAVGVSIVAFTNLRNRAYAKDNLTAPISKEMVDSYNEGLKAGTSWNAYFNSYRSRNAWKHFLSYGSGLAEGIKAHDQGQATKPKSHII